MRKTQKNAGEKNDEEKGKRKQVRNLVNSFLIRKNQQNKIENRLLGAKEKKGKVKQPLGGGLKERFKLTSQNSFTHLKGMVLTA